MWRTPEGVNKRFPDRARAGAALARHLAHYCGQPGVIVLGLVRGGVPVAAMAAAHLGVGLDVLVVRKLGVPSAPELAFGAIGPGGVRVFNEGLAARLEPPLIDEVVRREEAERSRREQLYRAGRPPLRLDGRTAIVVDDGLATGATARAAVEVARGLGAVRVVLAAPVGSVEATRLIAESADEVVCPVVPAAFGAVSRFYDDFHQVSDAEVQRLLTGYAEGVTTGGTVGECR
jgi:putative phosphoribosyl transferase